MTEPIPEDQQRIHVQVTGRVQGVGFRAFVQQSALSYGLTGWVRNVDYNSVEAVAEGAREALEKFANAVKNGPRAASVNEYRVEWQNPCGEFSGFGVRNSV